VYTGLRRSAKAVKLLLLIPPDWFRGIQSVEKVRTYVLFFLYPTKESVDMLFISTPFGMIHLSTAFPSNRCSHEIRLRHIRLIHDISDQSTFSRSPS
jgi:hypothetical protein